MKTKLFLLLVLFLFESFYLFSQVRKDTTNQQTTPVQQVPQQQQGLKRVYEFGLTFSSLNSFGVNFKIGNQKILYRLTTLALNFNSNQSVESVFDQSTMKMADYGAGLRFGFEKRIFLAKNFDLHLGSDAGIAYYYHKNGIEDSISKGWVINPAIYLVMGLAYQAGEHFMITAELSPSLQYVYGKRNYTVSGTAHEISNHNFSFALSNNSVSITIAYRILKTILFKW